MRFPLLALLCVGTTAFCQAPAEPKIDPDQMFQLPKKFSEPAPGIRTLKPLPPMRNKSILARPTMIDPKPKLNNPQIDPKIVLHPPWPGKGDAAKGKDVSRHLYPNLKFLPLHHGSQLPR